MHSKKQSPFFCIFDSFFSPKCHFLFAFAYTHFYVMFWLYQKGFFTSKKLPKWMWVLIEKVPTSILIAKKVFFFFGKLDSLLYKNQ